MFFFIQLQNQLPAVNSPMYRIPTCLTMKHLLIVLPACTKMILKICVTPHRESTVKIHWQTKLPPDMCPAQISCCSTFGLWVNCTNLFAAFEICSLEKMVCSKGQAEAFCQGKGGVQYVRNFQGRRV